MHFIMVNETQTSIFVFYTGFSITCIR